MTNFLATEILIPPPPWEYTGTGMEAIVAINRINAQAEIKSVFFIIPPYPRSISTFNFCPDA
jgi:hypothetical protein